MEKMEKSEGKKIAKFQLAKLLTLRIEREEKRSF